MDYPQTLTDQSGGRIWCGLLRNIIASGTTLCWSQLARYQDTVPCHQSPRWQTVPSLARNARHHHSQNHSFASSRMPRKSIMTKLPIWFDSLTTCRHDHNVWLSFFIIVICKSTVTVARAKQRFFFSGESALQQMQVLRVSCFRS